MVGGFDVDRQKQQEQMMNMRAQQQISEKQKLDFAPEKRKNPKDIVFALCIFGGLFLLIFLLARGGII